MDDELQTRFAPPNEELKPEILSELQSILRLHKISPEELSYKWESYCMKMGAEETKLDLKTTRDFKKDLQEILERDSRSKVHKGNEKRGVNATPRAGIGGGDVFGMLDNLIPNTPARGPGGVNGSTLKRKSNFETPVAKASKSHPMSSPGGVPTPDTVATTNFADRFNAGDIMQTLNEQLPELAASSTAPTESRVKLKANTDMAKFGYKTMSMKLSEASEILDDRIDEFATLVQAHHNLEDSEFGNPARESQSEIVAVGRIASDSSDGKLNTASLVLETSRRTGAGHRVPLKVDRLDSYDFFRGKIVAVRGTNASGLFFDVTKVLDTPLLGRAASMPEDIDAFNARVQASQEDEDAPARPVAVLVASGPYTTEDTLDFSPFQALLSAALEKQADTLVLHGPFLDIEHPLVRSGDFDLPSNFPVEPDRATLNDLFRYHITRPITALTQALPTINIILVPSVRDAIAKHAAYPQDRFVKRDVGLPKQVTVVTNPMNISLNEMLFGLSSQDIFEQLRASQVIGGKAKNEDVFSRLTKQVIDQRHYFPIFPPSERQSLGRDGDFENVGASLDVSYLKLGEILTALPDVLVLPSSLNYFIKVVEGVITINPGTLSKKRGPGTYAQLSIQPLEPSTEERENGDVIHHRLYERARVDIVKI